MKDILKSKQPFEKFLEEVHAKDYMGTDDDMLDNFEAWLTNQDAEEMIEHANAFGRLLIGLIRD